MTSPLSIDMMYRLLLVSQMVTVRYAGRLVSALTMACLLAGVVVAQPSRSPALSRFVIKYKGEERFRLAQGDVARLGIVGGVPTPEKGGNCRASFDFPGKAISHCAVSMPVWAPISAAEKGLLDTTSIDSTLDYQWLQGTEKGVPFSRLLVYPFRRHHGQWQKLTQFALSLPPSAAPASLSLAQPKNSAHEGSVLAEGRWVKFPTQAGINKLDYRFLTSVCGIPAETNPALIQVFGNGGYQLPEPNAIPRPADLTQVPVFRSATSGRLTPDFYLLFYSTGTVKILADDNTNTLYHQLNPYADTAYYFVTVGNTPGLSHAVQDSSVTGQPVGLPRYDGYQDLVWREQEQFNFINSGRRWWGDVFDLNTQQTWTYDVPGWIDGSAAQLRANLLTLGKQTPGGGQSGTFRFRVNATETNPIAVDAALPNEYTFVGNELQYRNSFTADASGRVSVSLSYNKNGAAYLRGYLDFFDLTIQRRIALYGSQTQFTVVPSREFSLGTSYQINCPGGEASAPRVWDVTDPLNVHEQRGSWLNANTYLFSDFDSNRVNGNQPRRYIVFSGTSFPVPSAGQLVANQNLKGQSVPDLLIVTHPSFISQANRLANLRRKEGLSVLVATTTEIYNEFSSGIQDLTAIRDCARFFYLKGNRSTFKYMTLFGAASYDYKDRVPNNTNRVPIFESGQSLSQLDSYASDDWVGFLDDAEGSWSSNPLHLMDIGVGRLVAQNSEQADDIIDKLENYGQRASLGAWRNRVSYLADDQDSFAHLLSSEAIANALNSTSNLFNPTKMYLDAYNKILGPGGQISPDCTGDVIRDINAGTLIFNYSGHGNETQWTDEQVVNKDIITTWKTENHYPFFTVGTCQFGRYDDPREISGGEQLLLQKKGGGIGTLTTTRLVFSFNNTVLVSSFMRSAFQRDTAGLYPRLGEVMRQTKNRSAIDFGAGNRNAGLLADPSMRLAMPTHRVAITAINDRNYTQQDTFSALEPIKLQGEVRSVKGDLLTQFNGRVIVSVFDKPTRTFTRGQVTSFPTRNNIIYRGAARVRGGRFDVSFVIPADISYDLGAGRISFYAYDTTQNTDANGADDQIIIGGVYPLAQVDTTAPAMSLYMNDTTFRNGGITAPDATLLVRLTDASGINLTTSGIGHEISAVLDGNRSAPFTLNNFYEADEGTFSRGWVRFPLLGLAPGPHHIEVKAWDAHNNSVNGTLSFVVGTPTSTLAANYLTWPNPTTDKSYFSLTHNRFGDNLTLSLYIFDATGKQIHQQVQSYPQAPAVLGANQELYWDNTAAAQGLYHFRIVLQDAGQEATSFTGRIIKR